MMVLALLLTTSLSGCEGFSKRVYVPAGTPVPALDARDKSPCEDPGVDPDLARAAVENRLAWAKCRRKHANVVGQYEKVRSAAKQEMAKED